EIEIERRLSAHGTGDGIGVRGHTLDLGEAVIARELLQSALPPSVRTAVAGPQDRARRSPREERDHRAAAVNGVDRTIGGANQLLVDIADTVAHDLDQAFEARIGNDIGQRITHHAAVFFNVAATTETV